MKKFFNVLFIYAFSHSLLAFLFTFVLALVTFVFTIVEAIVGGGRRGLGATGGWAQVVYVGEFAIKLFLLVMLAYLLFKFGLPAFKKAASQALKGGKKAFSGFKKVDFSASAKQTASTMKNMNPWELRRMGRAASRIAKKRGGKLTRLTDAMELKRDAKDILNSGKVLKDPNKSKKKAKVAGAKSNVRGTSDADDKLLNTSKEQREAGKRKSLRDDERRRYAERFGPQALLNRPGFNNGKKSYDDEKYDDDKSARNGSRLAYTDLYPDEVNKEKTDSEKISDKILDESGNLPHGAKVPGAKTTKNEINSQRSLHDQRSSTLNGSEHQNKPVSEIKDSDKRAEIASNSDAPEVDSTASKLASRKQAEEFEGLASSAPGMPSGSELSEGAAASRKELIKRDENGNALPSFDGDDVVQAGETLAKNGAVYGTALPLSVTESEDYSSQNIEAHAAGRAGEYVDGMANSDVNLNSTLASDSSVNGLGDVDKMVRDSINQQFLGTPIVAPVTVDNASADVSSVPTQEMMGVPTSAEQSPTAYVNVDPAQSVHNGGNAVPNVVDAAQTGSIVDNSAYDQGRVDTPAAPVNPVSHVDNVAGGVAPNVGNSMPTSGVNHDSGTLAGTERFITDAINGAVAGAAGAALASSVFNNQAQHGGYYDRQIDLSEQTLDRMRDIMGESQIKQFNVNRPASWPKDVSTKYNNAVDSYQGDLERSGYAEDGVRRGVEDFEKAMKAALRRIMAQADADEGANWNKVTDKTNDGKVR